MSIVTFSCAFVVKAADEVCYFMDETSFKRVKGRGIFYDLFRVFLSIFYKLFELLPELIFSVLIFSLASLFSGDKASTSSTASTALSVAKVIILLHCRLELASSPANSSSTTTTSTRVLATEIICHVVAPSSALHLELFVFLNFLSELIPIHFDY